jgi:hypothetical protein
MNGALVVVSPDGAVVMGDFSFEQIIARISRTSLSSMA